MRCLLLASSVALAGLLATPALAKRPAQAKAKVKAKAKAKAKPAPRAKSYKGRFELGALRSLSGARSIRVSHYAAPEWSVGAAFGLATFSHREPNDQGEFKRIRNVGRFMFSLEAFHWPLKLQGPKSRALRADLGLGGRLSFYWGFTGDDGDDDKTLDTPIELGLEIPLAVRLFVGSRVHLTPQFGLAMRYIPGSRKPDQNNDTDANPGSGVGERLGTTNGPGFGVEIGDHAGMFVGLSLGYLFGA